MAEEFIIKNFQTINQKFKDDDIKIGNLIQQVNHLQVEVAQLKAENVELKTKINALWAKSFGPGATTR